MNAIRVLIVDDHTLVRMGLKLCLSTYGDISVVGEAASGREALQQIEADQPQVVLMDLVMPKMSGVEVIRAVRSRWPEIKVLALTSFIEDKHVTAAIDAGAAGYILKDVEPRELVAAIRQAHEGDIPLNPQAARVLVNSWREGGQASSLQTEPSPLTHRETEVLHLLGHGKSNRTIAQELSISEKTVKFHVSSILTKFGVQNRTQAVRQGRQLGLLPPLSS